MRRRQERERRSQEAAALAAEHAELRVRLLAIVARTELYADELTAEIERWNAARKDQP